MARGRKRKVKSSGSRVGAEKIQLDAETRRVRLKNLIVMGKERGYLIYSEINDHLPEDVLDAEQIDGIIRLFENSNSTPPINVIIDSTIIKIEK